MSSVEQEVSRNSAGTVAAGRPVDEEWDAKREELRANGVQYCLSAYTDVHGVPKAKAVREQRRAKQERIVAKRRERP